MHAVGHHLVPMYQMIGPTAAVALLVLFLVGILRMLLDIVVRASQSPRSEAADGGSWEPSGEHCFK